MLHDPKHLVRSFLKFAEEQRGSFDYFYGDECACGQFFASIGVANWQHNHEVNDLNKFAFRALCRTPTPKWTTRRVKWSTLREVLREELERT